MSAITIGLFAHVDAGKTTFAEQLLYHTRSIRARGRVDHQDAYLDSHDLERARGITIFADQAVMKVQGATYYLIDTPGHVDLSPEMERAMPVMDYAVLIISAVEGVQGHTETVWQLLQKHGVPTFIFINKTDRVGADVDRVMQEIAMHLTVDACLMTGSLSPGEIGSDLIERVAERDEELLERYLEGATDDTEYWLRALRSVVRQRQLFLCASGSALQDIGIAAWLEQLQLLADVQYDDRAPFGGRVYKVRHDQAGARLTYMKVLSGKLKVRDEVEYTAGPVGEERISEKVTRIFIVNGSRLDPVEQVAAGDLCAVMGMTAAAVGQGVGVTRERTDYETTPTLKSKVMFDESLHVKDVLQAFRLLDAEDPSLNVIWEESLQEIHIHVMGLIQLEVLEQLVRDRFGFEVSFGRPEILYKETIDGAVKGYGHFEPLRHYAEVHLSLAPGERGSGITFENRCHVHDLSVGYQHLIETHIFERDHHGLLTGSPITDMKITLLTGAAHKEHTHGGDFREATFRAIRQGLEKAHNVLLEPYYQFKIRVELDDLGRVMSDIQRASGQFDPPHTTHTHAVITGRVPVATFMNYSVELASFTHGKGTIHLSYGGYDRCHNEQEVIAQIGYRKDADPLYTSASIFCARGAGYSVPWDQAESKMHLL